MTERGEIYDPDPDGNHAPEPPSEILAHLRGLDFVAGTSLRALFASIDELAARAVRAEAVVEAARYQVRHYAGDTTSALVAAIGAYDAGSAVA